MDIKTILNHPAIKRSELARRLYPNLPAHSAITKLNLKISGVNYRKVLPEEEEQIKVIWEQIKKEIQEQ